MLACIMHSWAVRAYAQMLVHMSRAAYACVAHACMVLARPVACPAARRLVEQGSRMDHADVAEEGADVA